MKTIEDTRRLGLLGATSVGVGAIVGGGILALAGVAFESTGPAAILAFALNGVIAVLTALSFAEMASRFPESGGTYTFSKKVLSVDAAFSVGWVVWFASIVAAVLYAVGFAYFVVIPIAEWTPLSKSFLDQKAVQTTIAIFSVLAVGWVLMVKTSGGGKLTNLAKVLVFLVLVSAGIWATLQQPVADTTATLKPFFAQGFGGLLQAMGFTFIALQGFDLIAAVGGEVRNPAKTLPRAMLASLFIALAIYIPLLFVVTAVGVDSGTTIAEAARQDPEGIVAEAARRFMGSFGYWLVVAGAILGMYSALEANVYAASRIAYAMARDRTLPAVLSRLAKNRNPQMAIAFTATMVSVVILLVPDVATAGAAASLIFLITFGLAHWLCFLVRSRSKNIPPPFQTPLFPAVPVIGGLACFGLALFQGITVPAAGMVAGGWLLIGGFLFVGLFASRARIRDASLSASNPELVRLRGKSSLVLLPIANPNHAEPLITLAQSLVPEGVGRVLMQHVVVTPADWNPEVDRLPIESSRQVLLHALETAAKLGVQSEALASVADNALDEVARVAEIHLCQAIVMGLSRVTANDDKSTQALEQFLSQIDIDVVILRAPANTTSDAENKIGDNEWRLSEAKRILVPVAGRGGHEYLMARVLGSLSRFADREITYLRVVPLGTPESDKKRMVRDLRALAEDQLCPGAEILVVENDQPLEVIVEAANEVDLIVLGATRVGKGQRVLGSFTQKMAGLTDCPMIILSNRSI